LIKNLFITNSTKNKLRKSTVHNFISKLKSDLNFKIDSLVINFVTADQIKPINKEYLGHNYSTDIITFNYSGENYTLDGEIFISLDDASLFAKKYNVSLENEILRLIIHGFLHMVGYDDKVEKDKKKMKRLENSLVNKYLNSINKFTIDI
jgi:rRNA maturation RNase YbeY